MSECIYFSKPNLHFLARIDWLLCVLVQLTAIVQLVNSCDWNSSWESVHQELTIVMNILKSHQIISVVCKLCFKKK